MLKHSQALDLELSKTRAVKAPELDGFQFFLALNSLFGTILETSGAEGRCKSERAIFKAACASQRVCPIPRQ